MLSTTANPTDGLDSTVPPLASPLVLFIPRGQRGQQAAEWSW
jgi:IMP dehydrogenase